MRQSLPSIKAIAFLPCSLLSPDILEKYLAGVPIGIFAATTPIEHYGNASCEAVLEYDNGSSMEKATLKFTTTDEIQDAQELAFVLTDVQGRSHIIGHREPPYPMLEIGKVIDKDSNIHEFKVTFSSRKSLIPCAI